MSQVDINALKKLREISGISLSKCKEALVKADGNLENALDILRSMNASMANKKLDRDTEFGACGISVNKDHSKAALIKICCETSPTAKGGIVAELVEKAAAHALELNSSDIAHVLSISSESLNGSKLQDLMEQAIAVTGENLRLENIEILEGQVIGWYVHSKSTNAKGDVLNTVGAQVAAVTLAECNDTEAAKEIANDIAMQVVSEAPQFAHKTDIPSEVIAKEEEIFGAQIEASGMKNKSQDIIDKIMEGKKTKFFEEKVLDCQQYLKNSPEDKYTVNQYLKKNGCSLGTFKKLEAKI